MVFIVWVVLCHLWNNYAEKQLTEWTTFLSWHSCFVTKQANSPQLIPTHGYVSKKVCFRSRISGALGILFFSFRHFFFTLINEKLPLCSVIIVWKLTYWQLSTIPNIDDLEGIQWIQKMYFYFIKFKKLVKQISEFVKQRTEKELKCLTYKGSQKLI